MKKRTRAALSSILFGDVEAEVRNAQIASFIPTERNIQKLIVGIEPVQDLHGYDNPWPAGGGKNLFGGSYNTSYSIFIPTGTEVTVSIDAHEAPATQFRAYRADDTMIDFWSISDSALDGTRLKKTITFTEDVYSVKFQNASADNIQIEIGSTATPYAPYSNICPISGWSAADIFRETSYDPTASPYVTVSFGQTVYGGRLDVVRGVLPVTHEIVDLGTLIWVEAATGGSNKRMISSGVANVIKAPSTSSIKADIICEAYPSLTADQVYTENLGISVNSMGVLSAYDPNLQTDAAFTSAVNGVHLVYALATPLEISLTPTQIATIQRQVNYVWADCGPIIELIS